MVITDKESALLLSQNAPMVTSTMMSDRKWRHRYPSDSQCCRHLWRFILLQLQPSCVRPPEQAAIPGYFSLLSSHPLPAGRGQMPSCRVFTCPFFTVIVSSHFSGFLVHLIKLAALDSVCASLCPVYHWFCLQQIPLLFGRLSAVQNSGAQLDLSFFNGLSLILFHLHIMMWFFYLIILYTRFLYGLGSNVYTSMCIHLSWAPLDIYSTLFWCHIKGHSTALLSPYSSQHIAFYLLYWYMTNDLNLDIVFMSTCIMYVFLWGY